MIARLTAVAAAVAMLVLAASPDAARAGTYDVSVCPLPGRASDGNVAWVQLGSLPSFYYYNLSCQHGQFSVGSGGTPEPTPKGWATGWQMTVPAPMTVQSLDIDWLANVTPRSGWTALVWGRGRGAANWLDAIACEGSPCPGSLRGEPMYGVAGIAFGVECNAAPCPAGTAGSIEVQLMRLHLNDAQPPRITATSGSLTSGSSLNGQGALAFHAVDEESGVRAAALEVDGREVQSIPFDTPSRSCVEPYIRFRPCPTSVDGAFTLDTFPLLDGPHQVRLLVRDATNENVGIAGPWTVVTSNRRVANICASRVGPSAAISLKPRRVSYGRGAAMSLNWPALPWPAADVALFTGADRLTRTGTGTQVAASRFVLEVPPGHTRVLRLGVRSAGSSGPFACTDPLLLQVRARVSLKVRPNRVGNGHRVYFRGRLAGGKRARNRAIVLEARAKHGRRRWIPVHVVRTGKHGRFRSSYRFARTYAATTFLFRARVPASPGFPYEPGHSRIRIVRVKP